MVPVRSHHRRWKCARDDARSQQHGDYLRGGRGQERRSSTEPVCGRARTGGATWKLLGTRPDNNFYDCQTNYIDLPINIRVDPQDSNHLYLTEGVRGAGNGFWVSWDGGGTMDARLQRRSHGDVGRSLRFLPCDCRLSRFEAIGVLETTDGGYSWGPAPSAAGQGWSGGSYGVNMLYDPASGQGDPKTWLVHNGAMWRTKDAGANWSKVSDIGGIHGFTTTYYAKRRSAVLGSWRRSSAQHRQRAHLAIGFERPSQRDLLRPLRRRHQCLRHAGWKSGARASDEHTGERRYELDRVR